MEGILIVLPIFVKKGYSCGTNESQTHQKQFLSALSGELSYPSTMTIYSISLTMTNI